MSMVATLVGSDVSNHKDEISFDINKVAPFQNPKSALTKKNGPTRNLSLSKKRYAKEPLTIEVNDNVRYTVGMDSQHFITKSGCVMQKIAKLNIAKWLQLG
ncbi:hypothetical protein ACH5RR_023577 [Cinchona calisaya]|uniref:Uncharacterized protein n=1 Tax=Cinchona calisaya TaxID=153742 RepID=A0ABD2ZEI1_9GENT